jgi:Txe/YoeB family toxin of Txe-Axe toxin-antitoxin module
MPTHDPSPPERPEPTPGELVHDALRHASDALMGAVAPIRRRRGERVNTWERRVSADDRLVLDDADNLVSILHNLARLVAR